MAGSIHRIAYCHIARKTQQAVIHILRTQFRTHSAGRIRNKIIIIIFFTFNLKIPLLHLLFDILFQRVPDLLPSCQPPQGITECSRLLIWESLQRLVGQIPFYQLVGKKGRSTLVPDNCWIAGMVFFCFSIQHILNALVCVFQHFRIRVGLMYQIITAVYTVALR